MEQARDVAGPAYGYGSGPHCVFEHQVPADDPSEQLTHGGVGVGVGAARNRDHGREFAVTHSRESAANRCDDKRQHDGWPGVIRRRDAGQREQPGADDGANA